MVLQLRSRWGQILTPRPMARGGCPCEAPPQPPLSSGTATCGHPPPPAAMLISAFAETGNDR